MQLNVKKDSIELVKFVVTAIADLKAELQLAVVSQQLAYAELEAAMAARNEVDQRVAAVADMLFDGKVEVVAEAVLLSEQQQSANVRRKIAEEVNKIRHERVAAIEATLDERKAQLSALLQGD